MNHYPHHIGDFNNATRHLTRVERSLYRDLIDMYYDTERPLPGDDFDRLARRVLAISDEEKQALRTVLDEFFVLEDGVYRQARCDAEILKYQGLIATAVKAGKASAEARLNRKSTPVERPLTKRSTNQNQEPYSVPKGTDGEPSAELSKAELWDAGRSLLSAQGMPDAQCRSFVGKLVKEHGNDVVSQAVRAAVGAQPQEAREYLIATCRSLSKSIPETVKAMTEPAPKWAIKAGFSDRFEANNAGCFEKTAHNFRDGKRIEAHA